MKTNFRSRVMKIAWQIRKRVHKAWRLCLKKAWEVIKLERALRKGVVNFRYTKTDGSLRMAVGTLRNIPSGTTYNGRRVTKQGYRVFKYFDVERNAFRSFRVENVIYPEF